MEILVQQNWNYTLFKNGYDFYLSVLSGSVGNFEFNIKLNEVEIENFNQIGICYIEKIADEIRNEPSKYMNRKTMF